MMQGRGRGSYLGLLLESSVGKSMVGSVSSSVSDEKKQGEVEDTRISSPQTVNGVGSTTSDASPKCTPSPGTWTSLDLLGNRGRRGKHGKEVLAEQSSQEQVKIKENENHTNSIAKDIETVHPVVTILTEAKRSSPAPVDGTTQRPSSLSLLHDVSSKEVHLSSPQDFMIPSTKITGNEKEEIIAEGRSLLDTEQPDDSSSDTCGSNSSSSSRYIPPHRRKGLDGKPEISCEKAVSENKRNDVREVKRQDLFAMNQEPCSKKQEPCSTSEAVDPQKLVESELNWQKWKLQRNFKKMLNSLAIDNALGLSKDIREMIVNSQLSTKFPGVSEVNVILELLVGRVLDEKEPIEVAVQVCRLLNAMYPHELPSNLREVLKEFRKDIFAGVANKNSRCDNFCLFLGKLCDVGKLETKSFQDCLRQSVIGCLYEWISPYQSVDENSHEAQIKVVYLCELLELTKNVMTTAKRSWVKSCFGKVKNCILSDKLPRGVKESLLDAIIRLLFHSPTSAEAVVDGKLSGEVDNSRLPTAGEPRGTDLQLPGDLDMYKDVKKMLSELGLGDFLEKFQANLIRDSLLHAEKNELKNTLQEAGFAPGAILEIQLYLERNASSQERLGELNNKETAEKQQQSSMVDSETRVKNLESNLQQILGIVETDRKKVRDSERENVFPESAEVGVMKHVALEEARNELMNMQASLNQLAFPALSPFSSECPPPPGLSNPAKQNSTTPSPAPKDGLGLFSLEGPQSERSSEGKGCISKREVFVKGERSDVTKDKKAADFAYETAGLFGSGSNQTWNSSGRGGFPKHKGRGRGRRDTSGSLATSKSRHPSDAKSEGNIQVPAGFDVSASSIGFPSENSGYSRTSFGCSMPVGCFICGSKDHRSAYCKNNAAMFD